MAKFKITGLPKAQIGGKTATSLLFSPYEQGMFSNSLHSIGGADPSFILGAERSNLFPIWGHDNGVRSSLSGQVQIPYAMNQIPGVKGRWTSEFSPNAGKSPVQFTTTGQLEGGYNPDQGFNASIMGWPHVWGSTVDVSRWRNPEKYYAGAVRAGIGPQLGASYMSGMMNTSGPNDISATDQMNTNKGSVHIGGRGYVEYTPTDWLKLRLDAQGMFDPLTKKVAEGTDAGNAAETENVNLKFSPGVQLTATVPIKALASNKKKASEEKVKMDAVKADDKNIMVEAPVMTGPGIDWEYRQKQQSTGVPVGHLPGYEPETGRQLTEAELMQRYGQGPRLAEGGTANDIYLDLDDDEIEQYRNAGYIVEELEQAKLGKNKRTKGQPAATATSIMSGTEPAAPVVVQPGEEAFDLNVGTVDHDPLLTAAWNRAVAYDNVMNKANELRVQNQKLEEDLWKKTLADRQAAFEKADKHDKIEPLQTIPIYLFEERQKKDPNYVKSLKEQGYLITTDKENGKVNLYPKIEIQSRIINNGLRTDEIVNKLGVGDKTLIDAEFADVIKGADEYHAYQTKKALQDLMLEKGWSKDKAIDYLVNTKKLGTKEGLEKLYNTDFKDIDKNVRSWYAYGEDYQPSYLDKKGNMVNDASLIGKWKDNDIITLARDRRFIDSYGANITQTSPNPGSDEYGAQVLQKLRSGKWGWNPKTNTLIKLGADEAYKDLAIDPTEEDVNEINRIGDYTKLTNQQFNDKYYGDPNEKLRHKEGYEPVYISDDDRYQATEWGFDENGNYTRFVSTVNVPVTDPNTGEVTFKKVPSNTLKGKTIYMSEADADAYRKASVGNNIYESWKHPGMYLPGVIGAGAFAPAVIPAMMNYAPISSLPWLNAGNAFNAHFVYEALRPEGDFSKAYDAYQKGDMTGALSNGLWGAFGVSPLFKPAIGTFRAYNALKTPGQVGVIPGTGKYSTLYRTPNNSGLLIGNTQLGNASPAFTSITDPLNKFLDKSSKILGKGSFGELRIMKQNPNVAGAAGVTPNLLGSGNLMSQSLKRTAQSTDLLGTNQAVTSAEREPLTNNGIISLIEDARTEQLDKWRTEEGQKRLSQWISENPHMKGLKPDDMIKGLEDLKNLNVENQQVLHNNAVKLSDLNKEIEEVDLMLETGAINEQQHVSMIMKLEDQRNLIEGESEYIIMQGENFATNGKLGRDVPAASKSGAIDLVKGEERDATYNILLGLNFTPEEAFVLSRHELQGHYTQRGKKTKMDDELGGLTLKESAVKPGDGTLFGETNTAQAGQDDWLGRNKDFEGYFRRAKDYFLNGSKGQEKTAFAAEVRADMLRTGAIKDLYDPITAKALKQYYDAYAAGGHDVPLRLFDIMDDTKKNFNKLSGLLNRLPVIAGALAVGEAMWDEDTKGEQKAGLGILAAGLLGRYRNLSGLGKFVMEAGNAFKVGKLRTATNETKLLTERLLNEQNKVFNEATVLYGEKAAARTKAETYKRQGFVDLNDPGATGTDKFKIAMEQHPGSTEAKRAKSKATFFTSDDLKRIENRMKTNQIQLTGKGELQINTANRFTDSRTGDPTIKMGRGTVYNFKTGENVDVSVKVPGTTQIFTKENGALKTTTTTVANPSVSRSLLETLADNVATVETTIPGAKVFGSTIGVLNGGLPHLSKDLDVMITEADYNKNVKDKFPFVQQFGPAKQHEVIPGTGEQGILDFNVIHEGKDGLVKPTIPSIFQGSSDYVPIEIELFRQFFPEEYAKASLEAMQTHTMDSRIANNLKIPLTPQQLIDGVDPVVKTIIDAMEAQKDKHMLKYDTYLSYGNPDAVAKAQSYYVRGLVGKNGSVGPQFDPSVFSEEMDNYTLLLEINFLGDKDVVAKDPKKMQNALNDFYINNTTYSRQIYIETLADPVTKKTDINSVIDAFKNWRPDKGGGTVNGIGLNTVRLGNPQHYTAPGNVMAQMQYNLKMTDAQKADPYLFIKEVKRQTSGQVPFLPAEQKIVDGLHDKYGAQSKGKTMEEIIANTYYGVPWDKQSEFLTELGKALNIKAVTRPERPYGNSVYSSGLNNFDEALDGMIISYYQHAVKPKSLAQRTRKVEGIMNNQKTAVIRTLKDFNKIESLLNGGLQRAEERVKNFEQYKWRIQQEIDTFANRASAAKEKVYNNKVNELQDLQQQQAEAQKAYAELEAMTRKAEAYRAVILGGLGLILGGIGIGVAQREKWANDEKFKKEREQYLKEQQEKAKKDFPKKYQEYQNTRNHSVLSEKFGGSIDKLQKFTR